MSSAGRIAKAFFGIAAMFIFAGYCLVASAESPTAPLDDDVKQLEALIEQQEALIKQQETLIEKQEARVKKQNDSAGQPKAGVKQPVKTTAADNRQEPAYVSVGKGKVLFKKWCLGCHDPKTTADKIGPGVKGILKKGKLPVSGKAATIDNICRQMKKPYKLMPSQFGLTDAEMKLIIKYLETL